MTLNHGWQLARTPMMSLLLHRIEAIWLHSVWVVPRTLARVKIFGIQIKDGDLMPLCQPVLARLIRKTGAE